MTGPVFEFPFNAGVMSVGEALLNGDVFRQLVAQIQPETFQNRLMRLADQIVLNFFFEGETQKIDARYNYNTTLAEDWIFAKDGVCATDALLVHYAGNKKPWDVTDPDDTYIPFGAQWSTAYRAYLATFRER